MLKTFLSAYAFIFLIGLLVGLPQCKKPDELKPTPNPNPGGENISDEERLAVMENVKNIFTTLINTDPNTALPQLLVLLQNQPLFEASGISDSSNCAWARFTDSRLLIIADNREPTAFENRGGRISFEPQGKGARIGELPQKAPVLLLNALGSHFIDVPKFVVPIFKDKGYKVSIGDASVEGLKKINTEDNAVFFMNTHGGDGDTRDVFIRVNNNPVFKKRYGFWTSDVVSNVNELKFKVDLDSARLVYYIATKDEPTKGNVISENHYAFTDKFVREYMKFGKNSLIYMEACGSYRDDMIAAFLSKTTANESLYLGWTHNSGDEAGFKAAKYVFDRLLGANSPATPPSYPKEDPPQRPFDMDAVHKDMADHGYDKYSYTDKKTNANIISEFKYISTVGTGAGEDPRFILNPSIEYLDIDEFESELSIYGIFGKDPGEGNREVKVNEVAVESVKSWEKDKIVCKIPYQGNGSAGDVVVIVREHESNPVPLTEWFIDFSMKENEGKAMSVSTAYRLHLRADVHRRRIKPGEQNPKPFGQETIQQWPFLINTFAKDSKATLTSTGSCAFSCEPCYSFSYESNGILEYAINTDHASEAVGFIAHYGWQNRDKLNLVIGLASQSHKKNHNACGTIINNTGVTDYGVTTLTPSGNTAEVPQLVFTNPDKFDFTIQANKFKFIKLNQDYSCDCEGNTNKELYATIEWKASTPKFAPTDKTPARIGVGQ